MTINEIKAIIRDQNYYFDKDEALVLREKLSDCQELMQLPHAIVITGLRRCGKSTLLQLIRKHFFAQQTIYYLTLEDEKLISFAIHEFDNLYSAFIELYGNECNTFFLDEIQELNQWEIPVRKYHDRKFKFILTGSNARLLSSEIGTKLTGRYVKLELFPFSFREYLAWLQFDLQPIDTLTTEQSATVKSHFNNYLQYGGIPEYVKSRNSLIIKQLYEDILFRDILVRHGLSNEKSLRELTKYLITNIGREFSYNKLKTYFNLGSQNTIKSYIGYLQDSYLLFEVARFDYSLKKQALSNKKIYVVDTAFFQHVAINFSENAGRILENIVFVHLLRNGKEVYFHKSQHTQHECDFVIRQELQITSAIQVCQTLLEPETRQREITGLLDAMNTYNLPTGLILTENETDELYVNEKVIIVKPLWKWLLIY